VGLNQVHQTLLHRSDEPCNRNVCHVMKRSHRQYNKWHMWQQQQQSHRPDKKSEGIENQATRACRDLVIWFI
jgi:hypothetical protein